MSEVAHDKRSFYIKWGVSLLLPLGLALFTYNIGASPKEASYYAVTLFALCMWALGLLSEPLVAIALPVAYIVLGIGTPQQILAGWSTSIGWVMLGGLIITIIMMQTGLAHRLAFKAISIARGSFYLLLLGLMLAGFFIAPLIPTIMGKIALICAICMGICETLKLKAGSREAAAVMLAGFIGVTGSKLGFLTGGGDVILLTGLISQTVPEITYSWGRFLVQQFVPATIYSLLSLGTLILVLRPKVDADIASFVKNECTNLKCFSTEEKKTAVMLVILVALLVLDTLHGIDPAWIMILIAFAMALPGIDLLTKERIASLKLLPVFFVVGCMAIGYGASSLGIDKQFAAAMIPYFQGKSEIGTMLIGYIAGTALNFLLTPMAAVSSMTVPITELVTSLNLSPNLVLYSFLYGLDQYIFPYEFAGLLYFYATGWIKLKHLIMVFSVRFLVTGLFLVGICYPWWKLTGFF